MSAPKLKLKAIRLAAQKGNRQAAKLGANEKQIQELEKCKTELEDTVEGIKNGEKITIARRRTETS